MAECNKTDAYRWTVNCNTRVAGWVTEVRDFGQGSETRGGLLYRAAPNSARMARSFADLGAAVEYIETHALSGVYTR